jgi:hypothetical protein
MTDPRASTSTPPPSLWPWLAVCAGVALWIDFGRIHGMHHGDSLVPVLTSLYHWTPYYWAQNRYGMLLPLLAMPVRHPMANLLVQDGLALFAGLSSLFLLARYVLREKTWPIVGVVSAAGSLAFMRIDTQFDALVTQPYGLSLALSLGALLLAEARPGRPAFRGAVLLAAFLMILAHWVNVGVAPLLGLVIFCRALWARPVAVSEGEVFVSNRGWMRRIFSREPVVAFALVGVGSVVGLVLMNLAPYGNPYQVRGLPIREWPGVTRALIANGFDTMGPAYLGFFVSLGAVGLLLLAVPAVRQSRPVVRQAVMPLLLAALCFTLFIGTRSWTKINACSSRYILSAVACFQTGLCALGVVPLARICERWARIIPVGIRFGLLALLPLASAAFTFGAPSLTKARQELDNHLGKHTAAVIRSGCTHLAGNYWDVWPAVFHANLVLHEHNQHRVVWGVAPRALATCHLWAQVPAEKVCVGVLSSDLHAAVLLCLAFGDLRPSTREAEPSLDIWRPCHGPASHG